MQSLHGYKMLHGADLTEDENLKYKYISSLGTEGLTLFAYGISLRWSIRNTSISHIIRYGMSMFLHWLHCYGRNQMMWSLSMFQDAWVRVSSRLFLLLKIAARWGVLQLWQNCETCTTIVELLRSEVIALVNFSWCYWSQVTINGEALTG